MSYAYQTFTAFQVLTAAQVQSVMDSVRDHQHGVSSVSSSGHTFASPTFTGTVTAAAATFSSTVTLSGTAANIALGSNFISNGGTDAGLSFDGSNNIAFTGTVSGVVAQPFRSVASGNGWYEGASGTGWKLTENGVADVISIATGGAITFASTITVNSAVVGAWTTPAFSAGNFTANGSMTWTVASGDVVNYQYTIINKMMTVNFTIHTSTVGGTPNTLLKIAVPASKTVQQRVRVACSVNDNGAGFATGMCEVTAGGTTIDVYKDATLTANWTAATDTTYVAGQITFEIG